MNLILRKPYNCLSRSQARHSNNWWWMVNTMHRQVSKLNYINLAWFMGNRIKLASIELDVFEITWGQINIDLTVKYVVLIDKEFLNHIKLKLVVQFLFFPIFWGYSYFVLFLNKNLLFSYFLVGEAKICKNIENEIIVVLCFRVRFIIKQVVCWLWCSNISENNSYICSFHDLYCPLEFCEQLCYNY